MIDQEIVPLRVVLSNFLNHIENLESQNCPEESYEAEFQDLKIFSENVKSLKEYSCLEGEKEVNRKKNRYKDILPFDISRVVLNEYAGIPGSDYINANFIKGASGSLAYIASQGPLPSTVNDFWRMVVQCEVQVIVMACNEEEAGKAKCEKYWVDNSEEKQFGMISVKLLKSSTVCPDFSVRTMRLKYANGDSIEERTVCQLHYVAWPDHGVPTVVQPLLDMVRLVRDTQASETLPVLVHCSAGCGRTGTICAIDYVWGLLRTGKLTNDFSLLKLIREMRKQRIAMVQTKEQYVLVHQAVRELFREQLCMIDSHPYENVDPNGLLIIKDEENTYDTIDYAPNNFLEDKRDNKEKESLPPPLPSKRNITKFSSKYEKEIENLSAQQRSMKSNIKNIVPIYSSRDKKKIDNKEYINSPDKINKRSNDKQIKMDVNKPILSKGILSVPQLESLPKCKNNVKRSKSLKVVRNCEKSSLSFCQSLISENKRRSSLESNFDEHIIDTDKNAKAKQKNEFDSPEQKKNVPHLLSKYDILKSQDHQTFVRSLTCLDLRPKMVFSHTNSVVSTLEDSLAKQRVKLLRSNTQINVFKKSNSYFQSKSGNSSPHVDTSTNLKIDSTHNKYSFVGNKKVNHDGLDKQAHSNLRLGPKPLKQQGLLKNPNGEDSIFKSSDRGNPSFQILDGLRYFKEPLKPRSSSIGRSEKMKNLSLEEKYEPYLVNKSLKSCSKPDKISSSSHKMIHSDPYVENVKQSSLSTVEPKYSTKTNQEKLIKSQKRLPMRKPISSSISKTNDFSPGMQNNPFSQKAMFREDFSRVHHLSSGHEDFLTTSSHMMEEYPVINDLKSSPSFNDSLTDEVNDLERNVSSWMERDNPRMQPTYSKPPYSSHYVMNRSPKGQVLLPNTPDDSKEVQRRLTGDMDNYEHMSNVPSTVFQETTFNKDGLPLLHNDVNYYLQNRKNIHQFNGSIQSSRHLVVPNAQVGSEIPSIMANRAISKNPMIQPKMDAPSGTQDVYFSSEFHRSCCNCFHSAPGVDLDQVAASITKNDESIMKATLEELQVRQTRLLMSPKERCPPKGESNSGISGDKKKQQQYL